MGFKKDDSDKIKMALQSLDQTSGSILVQNVRKWYIISFHILVILNDMLESICKINQIYPNVT